jgi:hypothetical protein
MATPAPLVGIVFLVILFGLFFSYGVQTWHERKYPRESFTSSEGDCYGWYLRQMLDDHDFDRDPCHPRGGQYCAFAANQTPSMPNPNFSNYPRPRRRWNRGLQRGLLDENE